MDLLKWVRETPIGLIPIPRVVPNLGIVVHCQIVSGREGIHTNKIKSTEKVIFLKYVCLYIWIYVCKPIKDKSDHKLEGEKGRTYESYLEEEKRRVKCNYITLLNKQTNNIKAGVEVFLSYIQVFDSVPLINVSSFVLISYCFY